MASPAATAKITLTYPIYAADFDPHNSSYLLVGGGGGESRSGVGNKITLLDAFRKQNLDEIVDVDLSREEDSVTSLAVAQSRDQSIIAFAGINSSEADQNAGKNEHLRSFRLRYPPRGGKDSDSDVANTVSRGEETQALGRVSLFTPSTAVKKETYQRVLRLSRSASDESSRLGAIATGLAPEGEVVIFDAAKTDPGQGDVRGRIQLGRGVEAGDLDIIHVKDGEHHVAYCTDYEVYITKIHSSKGVPSSDPQFVQGIPHPDTFASTKARPKFRSLRFLNPQLLVLLQNQPDRKGAELLVLEIPKFSPLGNITLRKSLHKAIKSATALSVALLPASRSIEPVQHAIAVAGQDNSITVFTLDHPSAPPFPSLAFRRYAFLPSVHPHQITSLTFSTFHPPADALKSPPQYLKLASTSVASTVVVHTFPLTPFHTSKPSSISRYVLRLPGRSEAAQVAFSVLISAIAIALGAFFLQAFTEIRGGTPEYLGAKGWLSERVHGYIARPYMFEDVVSAVPTLPGVSFEPATGLAQTATEELKAEAHPSTPASEAASSSTPKRPRLRDLVSQQTTPADLPPSDAEQPPTSPNRKRIVVSASDDQSVAVDLQDESQPNQGKNWEEMEESEKERWKKLLVKAEHWAVEEGEAVLKGILFSGWAGAVGEVVGGLVGE
ncbi:hypothetical protein MMC07_008841 [Pseudocyphellaria aurata]|nr:hypothetical protein [Pseudocyphellaria aurata]